MNLSRPLAAVFLLAATSAVQPAVAAEAAAAAPSGTRSAAAPLRGSTRPPFAGAEIYLRGTVGDWATVHRLEPSGRDRYAVTLDLSAGTYEFKVGDPAWGAIDFGSNDELVDGRFVQLTYKGMNVRTVIATPGRHRFTFDVRDPDRPSLTMVRMPALR